MFLIYMIKVRPYKEDWINKIEAFNEGMYLLVSYHFICFTDINNDVEVKIMIGWSCLFCAVSNLVLPNLYLVIKLLLRDCYYKIRRRRAEKKIRKKQEASVLYQQR